MYIFISLFKLPSLNNFLALFNANFEHTFRNSLLGINCKSRMLVVVSAELFSYLSFLNGTCWWSGNEARRLTRNTLAAVIPRTRWEDICERTMSVLRCKKKEDEGTGTPST